MAGGALIGMLCVPPEPPDRPGSYTAMDEHSELSLETPRFRSSLNGSYTALGENSEAVLMPRRRQSLDGESIPRMERPRAEAKVDELKRRQRDLNLKLKDFEALWNARVKPLQEQIDETASELAQAERSLEEIGSQPIHVHSFQPVGPESLSFVDTAWFGACCYAMVALNMLAILLGPKFPKHSSLFSLFDNVFLVWYLVEFCLKFAYFQRNLLFGDLSLVWWNWLDLAIVASGVLDQWLIPFLVSISGQGSASTALGGMQWLRVARVFRIFRILRILKLFHGFLDSDMKWTKSLRFELFMSIIIAINAVVMSVELDIEWDGWIWIENLFLVVYMLEECARLKLDGMRYFSDWDNCFWNYLDFIIVVMGMVDLWFMPLIRIVQGQLLDSTPQHGQHMHGISTVLRMMRLCRVLRLVKLVKHIKPLYRLTLGVIETMKAIQWVMVLTMLMLYAGSILWTELVGHGIIGTDEDSEVIQETFGTVSRSFFSLFRIMNGETALAESVFSTVAGQFLFCSFMVLANWGVLAILTSVVSDNMIAASRKMISEEEEQKDAIRFEKRVRQLNIIFDMIDDDHSGSISRLEWDSLLADPRLLDDLCDASGLDEQDLRDMWSCLSVQPNAAFDSQAGSEDTAEVVGTRDHVMFFDTFIKCSTQDADQRQFMLMRTRLEMLENKLNMVLRSNRRLNSVGVDSVESIRLDR